MADSGAGAPSHRAGPSLNGCRWLPPLVIALAVLGCFHRLIAQPDGLLVDADRPGIDLLLPGQTPTPGNDLTRLFLPHHLKIGRAWRESGSLPTWDPSGFGGRPLVGNPQAGLFYPPVWLIWYLGVPAALGWLTVGHLVFAGFGAYRLALRLGVGRFAATLAGVSFAASPYLLAQVWEGHYPHIWAASWFPWVGLAATRLCSNENNAVVSLALATALCALAGHPQEPFYLALALGLVALIDSIAAGRSGRWQAGLFRGTRWLGAGVLTLALVSVEWIPDLLTAEWTLRGEATSVRAAGRYHLDLLNVFQLFTPFALGGPADYFGSTNYWETVFSFGLVTLGLACWAVIRENQQRPVRALVALVGLAVVFSFGRGLGLFSLAYWCVPGISAFRVPARMLFLAQLGISLLAALGLDALARDARGPARIPVRRGLLRARLLLVPLVAFPGLALASAMDDWFGTLGDPWLRALASIGRDPVLWFILPSGLLVGALWCWSTTSGRQVVWALGGLAIVELVLHGGRLLVASPPSRWLGADPVASILDREDPGRVFRVRALDSLWTDLDAAIAGREKTNINDMFQLHHAARIYEVLYPMFDPNSRVADSGSLADDVRRVARRGRPDPRVLRPEQIRIALNLFSVGFVVSERPLDVPQFDLIEKLSTRTKRTAWIYRNREALPRVWIASERQSPGNEDQIRERLCAIDPRRTVLIDGGREVSEGTAPREVEWRRPAADLLEIERLGSGSAPAWVVVSEAWMPGWIATSEDGVRPLLRGNGWQQVVPLSPGGRDRWRMTYRPPGFRIGATLSLGTLALLILWWCWFKVWGRASAVPSVVRST